MSPIPIVGNIRLTKGLIIKILPLAGMAIATAIWWRDIPGWFIRGKVMWDALLDWYGGKMVQLVDWAKGMVVKFLDQVQYVVEHWQQFGIAIIILFVFAILIFVVKPWLIKLVMNRKDRIRMIDNIKQKVSTK